MAFSLVVFVKIKQGFGMLSRLRWYRYMRTVSLSNTDHSGLLVLDASPITRAIPMTTHPMVHQTAKLSEH